MSTFRILSASGERLSTAVPLKSGRFLQVFPDKKEFANKAAWSATWLLDGGRRVEETPTPTPKPSSRATDRLAREMLEFVDPAFLTNVVRTAIVAPDTVEITSHDGDHYVVVRSLDYFKAPVITKNGAPLTTCVDQWSPALTSSKWFLMVLFVRD